MTLLDEPGPAHFQTTKRARRWRRLRRVLGVLILVLGAAAVTYPYHRVSVFQEFRGVNQIVYWPGPAGSTIYKDPVNDWILRFPNSWHAQRIREVQRTAIYTPESHGVFISNDPGVSDPLREGVVPAELVAVRVAFDYGGGFTMMCDHDTPLPLNLARAKPVGTAVRDPAGVEVKHLYLPFSVRYVALYSVQAWIGSAASNEDVEILDQIVGSVRYGSIPLPYGWIINTCMMDE
jgi:hypothetical protein